MADPSIRFPICFRKHIEKLSSVRRKAWSAQGRYIDQIDDSHCALFLSQSRGPYERQENNRKESNGASVKQSFHLHSHTPSQMQAEINTSRHLDGLNRELFTEDW